MKNTFPSSNKPIVLYRYEISGHCHRVQLMMSLLEIPHEIIDLERDGSNQPDWLLEVSPMTQVPVIDDNDYKLADSNAILVYLVKKYSSDKTWLPDEPEISAKIQRCLSIAAGELLSGPAIARFISLFKADMDIEAAQKKSIILLEMLDNMLNNNDYLTGNTINISDVALYTYIAHAPEGGIELDSYSNVVAWLSRIESQAGFVPMKSSL